MELVPTHKQQSLGTFWGLYDASILAFGTYYFFRLSNDMKLLLQIGFLTNVASLVLSNYVPESPRYLIQKGKL